MSRQIKCTTCENWYSEASKICENCKNTLGKDLDLGDKKRESNKYKEFAEKLKGQSDWIDKFFERAKTGNIFMKGLAYFLQFMWMVYFSLLLFVAWLVFIVAG